MTEIICETNGEWTIETEYILRNDTETKKRLVKCKVLDDNNKWINAYDVWMSSLSQELRHGIDFRPDQRDKTDDNMMTCRTVEDGDASVAFRADAYRRGG